MQHPSCRMFVLASLPGCLQFFTILSLVLVAHPCFANCMGVSFDVPSELKLRHRLFTRFRFNAEAINTLRILFGQITRGNEITWMEIVHSRRPTTPATDPKHVKLSQARVSTHRSKARGGCAQILVLSGAAACVQILVLSGAAAAYRGVKDRGARGHSDPRKASAHPGVGEVKMGWIQCPVP